MNKAVFGAFVLIALFAMQSQRAECQSEVDIIGTVRFYSPTITEPQALRYGAGTSYVDSTDRDIENFIPPFPPPGNSFLVYLDRACDVNDGDPPCWWENDFRSVPADVLSGEQQQFSIEYRIGIINNTGGTLSLSILNPDWPAGVDSIHMEDVMLARAFDHTFTGPVRIELEDPLTSQLKVIVYYNLSTSSVGTENDVAGQLEPMTLQPNPINSGVTTIHADFKQNESLLVTNVRGQVLAEEVIAEQTEAVELETSNLASGMYIVIRVDAMGKIQAREILQVVR